MSLARGLLAEMLDAVERDPELAARVRRALGVAPAAPSEPEPLYLAIPAYARRLGVSERTAWSWARMGLPCIGTGRTRRVVVREADSWLRSRRDVVDDAIERAAKAAAHRAARRAAR